MSKIPQFALIILVALSAILFMMSMAGDVYEPMIVFAYVSIGITLALVVWGMVASVGNNPSSIKSVAINAGVFLAIIALSYALADGTVKEAYGVDTTESVSKYVGTGLYTLYILMAGSVLAIVYSGINKMIK